MLRKEKQPSAKNRIKDMNNKARNTFKTLRGGFKSQPAVVSGSGRLALFITLETTRNRAEPPVDRRFRLVQVTGFETAPNHLQVWA